MTDVRQWIHETWLATRLGLNRDELRELRKRLLVEGPDFRLEKNRVIVSPAGEKKLRDHLQLPREAAKAPPAAPPAAPGAGAEKSGPSPSEPAPAAARRDKEEIVTLLVWRANLPNRRIVEAYLPGKDPTKWQNILRVKVKDAGRFNRYDNTGKPMALPAIHLQADLYQLAGAQPRRKGRW
jgi:hypothetical protein